MPTTVPTVPHCSQCGGVKLRSTPPTKTGCYRICSACDHMWHEPTAASLKKKTVAKKSKTASR